MPQTKEQRRYWAERRKKDKKATSAWNRKMDKVLPPITPKRPEPALLATSLQEYKQLRKEYPDMHIRLDTKAQPQLQLFDTLDLKKK